MINFDKTKKFRTNQYRKISSFLHSRATRILMATVILLGLFAIVGQSFESMQKYTILFHIISFFSALIFTIEYVLRIICAPHDRPDVPGYKARLMYIFSFMGFIDFISVLPFTMPYIFSATITGHSFEIARLFLIFKLFRYSDSFKTISTVLSSVKYELLTSLTFGGIIVGFCAVTMYYAERDAQPDAFDNIGQGFWWALITFTSVGYGDIYPITALGKVLTSCMLIVGICVMALPSAIVSGAFISYLNDKKEAAMKREEKKIINHIDHTEQKLEDICSHCGQTINKNKHDE